MFGNFVNSLPFNNKYFNCVKLFNAGNSGDSGNSVNRLLYKYNCSKFVKWFNSGNSVK